MHAVSGMEYDWWKQDIEKDFRIESCPFFNVTLLLAAATELKWKLINRANLNNRLDIVVNLKSVLRLLTLLLSTFSDKRGIFTHFPLPG